MGFWRQTGLKGFEYMRARMQTCSHACTYALRFLGAMPFITLSQISQNSV